MYRSWQHRRSCVQQADQLRQGCLAAAASAAPGISGTATPEPVGLPLQQEFRDPPASSANTLVSRQVTSSFLQTACAVPDGSSYAILHPPPLTRQPTMEPGNGGPPPDAHARCKQPCICCVLGSEMTISAADAPVTLWCVHGNCSQQADACGHACRCLHPDGGVQGTYHLPEVKGLLLVYCCSCLVQLPLWLLLFACCPLLLCLLACSLVSKLPPLAGCNSWPGIPCS